MKKKILAGILGIMTILVIAGCTDADTVSHNLSKQADSFSVQRKVVFFNGITDNYLLTIEGLCAINVDDPKKITVTCEVGKDKYKKHYLGLSDNVSYFVEQTDAQYADKYHYKVLFRPKSVVPDVDVQTK